MNSYSLNDPDIDEQVRDIYVHPERYTAQTVTLLFCLLVLIVFICYKVIPAMRDKRKRVSENK